MKLWFEGAEYLVVPVVVLGIIFVLAIGLVAVFEGIAMVVLNRRGSPRR